MLPLMCPLSEPLSGYSYFRDVMTLVDINAIGIRAERTRI